METVVKGGFTKAKIKMILSNPGEPDVVIEEWIELSPEQVAAIEGDTSSQQ